MTRSPGPRALAGVLLLLLVPGAARAEPPPAAPPASAPLDLTPPALRQGAAAPYVPLSPEQLALLHRKRRRHLGLLGAAGVLALAGGTFGLISRSQESSASEAATQLEARKTLDTAHRNATIANVGFAAAGLAVVGAGIAYLIRPPLPSQRVEVVP